MTDDLLALRGAFDFQIAGCRLLGSTFSAAVLTIIIDDIEAGGPFAGLAEAWAGLDVRGLMEAAAPLRPRSALCDERLLSQVAVGVQFAFV